MSNSFLNRLQRLHDAHHRGRDSKDGPTGVYSADDVTEKEVAEPSGYGWERLGATKNNEYGRPLWIARENCDPKLDHGDWTLSQCADISHRKIADFEEELPESVRRSDLLYMDTETTGLGPDSLIFMVGLAFWEGDQFTVEHLLLDDEEDEPALLKAFADRLARKDVLVTFNGVRFDVPLLKKRYAKHGLVHPFGDKYHLDVLPLSRRVFPGLDRYRLVNLEGEILHFERVDDVPGKDIPPRWWKFQKNRNAELMRGVLEHNRHDVVSMEALIATAINGGCPAKPVEEKPESMWNMKRHGFMHSSKSEDHADDDAPEGGVAEKLERTYRLRGIFAKRDKKSGRAGHGSGGTAGEPAPPPVESVPTSGAVAARTEELSKVCRGLIDQDLWREVFPMLCEIVALDPGNMWAVEMLAKYYRRDGNEELARALEGRGGS